MLEELAWVLLEVGSLELKGSVDDFERKLLDCLWLELERFTKVDDFEVELWLVELVVFRAVVDVKRVLDGCGDCKPESVNCPSPTELLENDKLDAP